MQYPHQSYAFFAVNLAEKLGVLPVISATPLLMEDKKDLFVALKTQWIDTFIPLDMQKYFRDAGLEASDENTTTELCPSTHDTTNFLIASLFLNRVYLFVLVPLPNDMTVEQYITRDFVLKTVEHYTFKMEPQIVTLLATAINCG